MLKDKILKNKLFFLLALQALICFFTILFFNGTADSGDSLVHYLFARYAPFHSELYFDHWAKPVFVLLASPFAQMGFTGMKIFNSIVSIATIFFTYKTAEFLKVRNPIVVVLIMMFSPLNYIFTFSGLTEPLFALFTIVGIYFCLKGNYFSASLVISFLPYVRSEGLIIIGVFVLYFLWIKMWKAMPLLVGGSVVYSIAGYFVYHDFLWVFTKIPYATLNSVYGSGPITHFVEQLINVLGVPIYFLFWTGFFVLIFNWYKKRSNPEEVVLLLFAFASFFIAHSLFWYLGIFNSFGLKRVLLGVMPVMGIIALMGFNVITEDLLKSKKVPKLILRNLVIIYMLIFPFTANPSAIQWEKDMMLTEEQLKAEEAAQFFLKEPLVPSTFIFNHPQLSIALNIDPYDESKHKKISAENVLKMKSGDVLILDNILGEKESDIKKEQLDSTKGLVKVFSIKGFKNKGREVSFVGYVKD